MYFWRTYINVKKYIGVREEYMCVRGKYMCVRGECMCVSGECMYVRESIVEKEGN